MSTYGDVHVRICGQEIIKYDLEIKALIQVRPTACDASKNIYIFILIFLSFFKECPWRKVD